MFLVFLHDDRDQHYATSGQGIRFPKKNPGVSFVLSIKRFFFLLFLRNATINTFDFLYDDKGQNCATSSQGNELPKKNPGIVQELGRSTFPWELHYEYSLFLA